MRRYRICMPASQRDLIYAHVPYVHTRPRMSSWASMLMFSGAVNSCASSVGCAALPHRSIWDRLHWASKLQLLQAKGEVRLHLNCRAINQAVASQTTLTQMKTPLFLHLFSRVVWLFNTMERLNGTGRK